MVTPYQPTTTEDMAVTLLEVFTSITGTPVTLFLRNEERVLPSLGGNYIGFCRWIRGNPEGLALCQQDHRRQALESNLSGPVLCHAGLWGYAAPIKLGGRPIGAFLAGGVRLIGEHYEKQSLARLDALANRLHLSERERLRSLFSQVPELSPAELASKVRDNLSRIQRWYQSSLDDRAALEDGTQKITHEFQIRLQGLLARSENLASDLVELLRTTNKPRILVDAEELVREHQRWAMLIQNLGGGDGLGHYDFRQYDIGRILRQAKELFDSEAEAKGVTIELVGSIDVSLEMSPDHISQAVNNLVQNAVKYSFRGVPGQRERQIRIVGEKHPDGFKITIRNYGIGILPHEYENIFQRGYRGALTRDEYRTGSGLGLAVAKEIVERHGGNISVRSWRQGADDDPNPPYLTRFVITLPYEQPTRRRVP